MKLGLLNFISALSILLPLTANQSGAQTPQRDNRPRTASISGLVTVGGAPAPNTPVTVMEVNSRSHDDSVSAEPQQRAIIKVRTDSDGRYRVTGLTEGSYLIRALSKAYAPSRKSSDFNAFKSVTLDEGESRENVDLALVRGGVVTGRVVDEDGKPLIASRVNLSFVDENGKPKGEIEIDSWSMLQTDDRGVYRIYGLPAGRYIVSAGGDWVFGHAKRKYPETFHPDATDRNQAKIIEVKEGAELVDIDIRLGAGKDAYVATGRVVDAETGQPLPYSRVECREAPDNESGGRRYGGEAIADQQGRFRIAGLPSGRYDLRLRNQFEWYGPTSAPNESKEHYSENTRFEVSGSDVSGLEIRAIRGSSISGMVVLEGFNDQAIKAMLQEMTVIIFMAGRRDSAGGGVAYENRAVVGSKIGADGGFRATGAPPGLARFYIGNGRGNTLPIKRIERNGAEISSAIEINRGEQIAGVRVVVANANGTIRGYVEIAGGIPDGWELKINAMPIGTTTDDASYRAFESGIPIATANEKGRFTIERLVPGEYELRLHASVRVSKYEWSSVPGTSEIKQRVTVIGDAVTPVKLTFDPARARQEDRR